MKISVTLISLILLSYASFAQKVPEDIKKGHRIEKIINSQWTFNYFPATTSKKGYDSPAYDDSQWPVISIPHTWSTYETSGEVHPFIRNASEEDNPYWWTGWGWYRKHFSINSGYSDRKVFIEFEGVQKYCKVWLNGKYLGDHKGGYGSFDFDITDILKQGADNLLAVSVNNRQQDEFKIPPMAAGNFNVYGGIYRDVRLVLKDKLYIPMQGSASHEGGTFITTPKVSEAEGIVRIQTWVKNDYKQKKSCTLRTYIIDASEKVIQVIRTEAVIDPGQIYKFDQISKAVKNPHLWSNDDPYLYKVVSQIFDEKTLTDSYSSPLGFRWFRWDYNENLLYLNGKKMIIHGGNRHQEYPWLGDAIPKWITAMDFKDIAENLNYNFLRTAHYPNDIIVYDLADKYGIVIDEESPSIGNQDFSVEVQQQQMKEMIRRDRNHPSILMWSMGNETDHAVDSKFAAAEDTTRILTARRAKDGSAGAFVRHTDDNLAIEDLLRCTIRGWYDKDVRNLEPADGQQCGTEEHHQNMLKASGKFGTGNLCTWLYQDHGTDREYLNSPLVHVNPKGYVDVYRIPKYAYYFWQANYAARPMIYIQPHNWRSRYFDQLRDIVVMSNCDKVELFVNGVSKGYKILNQLNFHSVTFNNVRVEAGTICAVGTKGDKTIKTDIVLAGRPVKIVLSGSHNNIKADRGSVVILKADITDSQGNHVYGATNTIKWTISGPATLVGPPVYESDINKKHMMDGVWYMDMPVSNIIRSDGTPGKICVMVSGSGLTSGTCDIEAVEMLNDNSVVSEPVLQNEGRKAINKSLLLPDRMEDVPQELVESSEDVNISGSDKASLVKLIREYIKKFNPAVDTSNIEFRTLSDLLAVHLINNGGRMSADDYNFNINHFNKCRLISGYINATKLPPLYKEGLKQFYSNEIIIKGNEKDAGDEMNWLNWIPSGGTVVYVQEGNSKKVPKGALVSKSSELEDIISVVYPQFVKFSADAKERALVFISKANPYVHANPVNEQSKSVASGIKTAVLYTAEKDKPILIPLLKFLSE